MPSEYRTLSKIARQLLNNSEGMDVEFKREMNGLKPSTLIAFANSNTGGNILIGVKEVTINGIQRGEICGCDVSDSQRMIITNKAADCSPPVNLNLYVENLNKDPFFRIEVLSGKNKPYCTKSGEYLIREDGRCRALHQDELLAIFMNKEGEKFISRFREAVTGLENRVESMDKKLHQSIEAMVSDIQFLDRQVHEQLDEIHVTSEESQSNTEESMNTVNELFPIIDTIGYNLQILMRHLGA
jgi:predicted HTH transcriptional regulator